jgi:hypothetical protein
MQPETLDRLNWYLLPPLVRQIAERCGRSAAFALLREFNGRRIQVPVTPNESCIIAQRLTPEQFVALVRAYPGQEINVPRAYHAILGLRNDTIRAARQDGKSVAEIAVMWGLTERQVWKILGASKDDRQTELF